MGEFWKACQCAACCMFCGQLDLQMIGNDLKHARILSRTTLCFVRFYSQFSSYLVYSSIIYSARVLQWTSQSLPFEFVQKNCLDCSNCDKSYNSSHVTRRRIVETKLTELREKDNNSSVSNHVVCCYGNMSCHAISYSTLSNTFKGVFYRLDSILQIGISSH